MNAEGSVDMYYKGGNMLHTIRQVIGNDTTWRAVLRGRATRSSRTRIVTGRQIQEYISAHAGIDLQPRVSSSTSRRRRCPCSSTGSTGPPSRTAGPTS